MTTTDRLVEQHIREYESRLKHLNELYERAHQLAEGLDENHSIKAELAKYKQEKAELDKNTEQLEKMSLEHWREETIRNAGPMAILDILAQKLEDVIERAEK